MSFNLGWRWMFASQSVPILFFIGGLFVIPESPRWLIKKNRNNEAYLVLKRINGESVAQTEMKEIEESIQSESGKFSELFQKGIRLALIIAVCLAFFQQWSGRYTIAALCPTDFPESRILHLLRMQYFSQ